MAKKNRLKAPKVTTVIILIGLIIIVGSYFWARSTFEDNIATGQPNSFAGILGLAGLALVVITPIYTTVRKRLSGKKKNNSARR